MEVCLLTLLIISVGQKAVFHLKNIWYCDEITIALTGFLKFGQAQYLNLVHARPSHVEHVSLRLYSFLEDITSALLRFAQVAYE